MAWKFETHENEHRLRALCLYSLDGRKERGDLIQAIKNIKSLDEIRGHREAILQIKGNKTLRGNKKTIVREHVITGLRGISLAVLVVNCWNKLPGEVVEVESVREFKEGLENAWLAVFGEDRV